MSIMKSIFSQEYEKKHKIIKIFGLKIKTKQYYNNNIYITDGNGIKKRVKKVKGIKIIFNGSNSTVTFKKPLARFYDSEIILSNNCNVTIGSSKYKINNLSILMSKDNGYVDIKDDFSAKNNMQILLNSESNKTVTIGENCMFGSNVIIRTGDVHTIYDINKNVLNCGKDVKIGNNVWCAFGVTILKGVSIEDGCVVGTHSVVTKSLKTPHSIYAGIPAVLIKKDIYWDRKNPDSFKRKILAENKINEE